MRYKKGFFKNIIIQNPGSYIVSLVLLPHQELVRTPYWYYGCILLKMGTSGGPLWTR